VATLPVVVKEESEVDDGDSFKFEVEEISEEDSPESDVDWDPSLRQAPSSMIKTIKRERKAKKREQKKRKERRRKGLPSSSEVSSSESSEDFGPEGPLTRSRKAAERKKLEFLALFRDSGSQFKPFLLCREELRDSMNIFLYETLYLHYFQNEYCQQYWSLQVLNGWFDK